MPNTSHGVRRQIEHRGLLIPTFIYGTAWKELQTEALVRLAIDSGFRGIDMANQRRHYYEAGVGEALKKVLGQGKLMRRDLFLQSKFTYAAGQDHRLPYDPDAGFTSQVRQSVESSLNHLHTTYLDSYILHGPSTDRGLTGADWEVWRAMEGIQQTGVVKMIGVSNISLEQLRLLLDEAEVIPAFVQNRCFAKNRWDAEVRDLCRSNDIIYQGFSLLTANAAEMDRIEIRQIADRVGCSLPQLVFRFALQVGIIPLTGTTNQGHMREDLSVYDWELSEVEIAAIESVAI
jgi:diketogulonate reductase-like aldo/keto reductase